ncbi:MAG: hypothetical protein KatS3mg053_2323 [Candidatus Roseilinea sp.]|nr:MAG: hypothetical protein KatS3mg053_2323 [Candidatus Roseilinea sp.]
MAVTNEHQRRMLAALAEIVGAEKLATLLSAQS